MTREADRLDGDADRPRLSRGFQPPHRLAVGPHMDMEAAAVTRLALTVTPTIDPLSIDLSILTGRTIGLALITAASIVRECGAGGASVGAGGAGSDGH